MSHRNLACVWANFHQAGADRLILARVLKTRSLVQQVTEAVPGARITVVRLRAPLAVLHERIRSREAVAGLGAARTSKPRGPAGRLTGCLLSVIRLA